ncbi:MAG: MBL fold metallo-hydrolase [Sandaracinaceae bacterium]
MRRRALVAWYDGRGRLLVVDRTLGAGAGAPVVDLPGGEVEPEGREDPRAAALRGLLQETGYLLAEGDGGTDPDQRVALRDAFRDGGPEEGRRALATLGLRWRVAPLLDVGRRVGQAPDGVTLDERLLALPRGSVTPDGGPDADLLAGTTPRWATPAGLREAWAGGRVLLTPTLSALLRLGDEPEEGALRLGSPEAPSLLWEVAPGLWREPFRTPTLPPATHTNAYLIGARELLLVEPGPWDAAEQGRLLRWVREVEGAGRRVVALVPTHHHRDHVGALGALAARLDVPVWAHPETASRLPRGVAVAQTLEEGDVLTLDGPEPARVRCLFTPGHAPGHLCLSDVRSGALLCGDMVASVGTILVEPGDGDMGLYLASLERMMAEAPSMLLPAHGMPLLDPAAVLRRYIAHRLAREAKVAEALLAHDGPARAADLLPRAYADTPRTLWPLAALSTEAHLIKLERDGRARSGPDGWVKA